MSNATSTNNRRLLPPCDVTDFESTPKRHHQGMLFGLVHRFIRYSLMALFFNWGAPLIGALCLYFFWPELLSFAFGLTSDAKPESGTEDQLTNHVQSIWNWVKQIS